MWQSCQHTATHISKTLDLSIKWSLQIDMNGHFYGQLFELQESF